MPQVSVLMAVYNGMPYLPEAIESILNQSFTDFEFIIVNDCSTDNTRDVILSYADPRIHLIDNEENLKQTKSLNKGLEHAQCEFIARMDDDDISHPERLEKQYQFLMQNQDVAVVGANLRFIVPQGRVYAKIVRAEGDVAIRWMQFFTCPISNGATMFRKAVVWEEIGGYDPNILLSQDWDLWSRIPVHYHLANLPEYLLDIRQHPGQETVMAQDVAKKEDRMINIANSRRILGREWEPNGWEEKMELLLWWETQKRRDNPDQFLDLIDELFSRYCERYPMARFDPDVSKQLARQYFIAINSSGFKHWRTAYKAFRKAWPIAFKGAYILEFFRWITVNLGARRLNTWLRR